MFQRVGSDWISIWCCSLGNIVFCNAFIRVLAVCKCEKWAQLRLTLNSLSTQVPPGSLFLVSGEFSKPSRIAFCMMLTRHGTLGIWASRKPATMLEPLSRKITWSLGAMSLSCRSSLTFCATSCPLCSPRKYEQAQETSLRSNAELIKCAVRLQ